MKTTEYSSYNPGTLTPLFGVPASGGTLREITSLNTPQERNHLASSFLPDGRRFLFFVTGNKEAQGIYLGSLDGAAPKRLVAADSTGVFVAPDYVIFVQEGALVARRLDLERGELTGETTTVASPSPGAFGIAGFSASANGVIAYREARKRLGGVTTWFDAAGNLQKTESFLNGPALSPDERFLAYDKYTGPNRDVWISDLVRGGERRFTTNDDVDGYPVWSPNGQQLIFESDRDGTFDLWIAPVNRVGDEQIFVGTDAQEIPLDWSSTGYVLYRRSDADYGSSDLVAVAVADKDRKPIVVADTRFEERMGSFSPDGKWVAYDTERSGRFEVVVQAFPAPDEESPISTDGGQAPLWSRDGGEIYFTAPDGAILSARVTTEGSIFSAEAPKRLFPARIGLQAFNQEYAVTRDRHFVVTTQQIDDDPEPITVLLNWKP